MRNTRESSRMTGTGISPLGISTIGVPSGGAKKKLWAQTYKILTQLISLTTQPDGYSDVNSQLQSCSQCIDWCYLMVLNLHLSPSTLLKQIPNWNNTESPAYTKMETNSNSHDQHLLSITSSIFSSVLAFSPDTLFSIMDELPNVE